MPWQEEETPVDIDDSRVVLDVVGSNWNIMVALQAAFQLLPRTFPKVCFMYIMTDNFDLMGQLNTNADNQVSKDIREYGEGRPFVILSPLTRAHLLFQDG